MAKKFRGILPAIVSPCDAQDRFLENCFAALADHLYEQGVHGLYVCGATGDGYNMRLEERKQAVAVAVDRSKRFGGIVIAHVGTSNTRDSVELAEHAAAVGADAVSCMPPANRGFAELTSYYRDVAKAIPIPTLIYHIPELTGCVLSVSELCRLLDLPNVVGIKCTGGDLFLRKSLLQARPGTLMFNGDDELLTLGLLYGACGGIGLTYNLFPKFFVTLYEAVRAGKIARALEMQDQFCALLNRMIAFGIKPALELILRERGYAPFCFRRPRTVLTSGQCRQFHRQIDSYLDDLTAIQPPKRTAKSRNPLRKL